MIDRITDLILWRRRRRKKPSRKFDQYAPVGVAFLMVGLGLTALALWVGISGLDQPAYKYAGLVQLDSQQWEQIKGNQQGVNIKSWVSRAGANGEQYTDTDPSLQMLKVQVDFTTTRYYPFLDGMGVCSETREDKGKTIAGLVFICIGAVFFFLFGIYYIWPVAVEAVEEKPKK